MQYLKKNKLKLLLTLLVLTGCGKGNEMTAKFNEDPNKNSLVGLLTFDNDSSDLFKVKNEAKAGESYTIEGFRNDITSNIFYQEAEPAHRMDSQVDGKALVMDGYSNFINCGSLLGTSSSFSVNLWAALRSYEDYISTRNVTPLIECFDIYNRCGFVFGFTYFGKWGLLLISNGRTQEIYAEDRLSLYSWHNLGFSYDNGEVKLFKNGVLAKSQSVSDFTLKGTETILIGKNSFNQTSEDFFPNNWFSGSIDEIRIYSTALESHDFQSLNAKYLKDGKMPECTFKSMNFPSNYLNKNVYRSTWHGHPHAGWVSDTNGGFYYNGNYHLFFTKSDFGPELRGETWGHVVSPDMVHWHEVQPAITCEEDRFDNRWVFAGSGAVIQNVPYIFYTGFHQATPSSAFSCTISMATPTNLQDPDLEQWRKMPEVQLHVPSDCVYNEFRDPQVYIEHDTVFLIVVSKRLNGNPCILGFSAPINNITNWTYRGIVFEVNYSSYKYSGYMWEVPIFLRLTSPSGNKVKYLFAQAPINEVGLSNDSIYFLGDFNWQTCRYTVTDLNARRYDFGSDYFSCSGGEIFDPIGNRTVVFETLQCCWNLSQINRYQSGYSAGWNMGRYYSLDEDGKLVVNHIDYSSTYGNEILKIDSSLASSLETKYDVGRSYRLNYKMKLGSEKRKCGFNILSSKSGTESFKFYYDPNKSQFVIDEMTTSNPQSKCTKSMPYVIDPSKEINIEIFVDHSTVEIYIDNKAVMSGRAYNNLHCTYIVPIGSNWTVSDLTVTEMKGVY